MRITVAGGSGLLGGALVERLRRDGHEVAILTRRPRHPGDVNWSPGSPGASGWTSAVDGADAVVNLAGESIAGGRWTPARKHAILESRLVATRALVGAMRGSRQPPAVLLSGSAVGVYGSRGEEPLTEDSPPGSGFLAEVCRQWEAVALEAAPLARVVLLRTGLVLDAHGGALPEIARPFRFLAGGRLGSGRQYASWIHLDDWVSMAAWALGAAAVRGPINLTAPAPVTNTEFARALGRALGRPALVPAPAFALRLALGEMADELLLGGQRVLPAKAQALGFAFHYPAIAPALRAIYGTS